jgi:non-heme chloroperoxidase
MLKSRNISTPKSFDTRKFIETEDGTSLFYKDWGTGKPVVFIHGWGLGADMWEYQMLHLASFGLRCIAYDRRGCGHSSQPDYGYDYDTFADDLATLIEQLDLDKVTLVGYSSGGGDVARYLSRAGAEHIEQVVFLSTTTPFLLKTTDNPDGLDKSVFDDMVAALKQDRPHYLAASAAPFFGVGLPNISVSPEMMQWGVGLALQTSPKATIDMVRAFSETDFRSDIHALTIPTLIVHGDADTNAPIDITGRKTAQLIAGSQIKVYEGAPHGLFITHKERLNADLLAFIQG